MSKPKITVTIADVVHKAAPPFDGADHAVVEGIKECVWCKAPAPFKIAGAGRRIESHDTYAADAVAVCCKSWVGTLRVQVDTLFGIEEDERVLRGRCRVY